MNRQKDGNREQRRGEGEINETWETERRCERIKDEAG